MVVGSSTSSMDVDETKEPVIAGDVLIVETQHDDKINNSFSSLEIDSDFSSQQISAAFGELKAVSKKFTNNIPIKDNESDFKLDSNSNIQKKMEEKLNGEHLQSNPKTPNTVHDNLHDTTNYDEICVVAEDGDAEQACVIPTPSLSDENNAAHIYPNKTHETYNLKQSQIIRNRFITSKLTKNKNKSFKINKHVKAKSVSLYNKGRAVNTNVSKLSIQKYTKTCQSAVINNTDGVKSNSILVIPDIHKTLNGADVKKSNANNIQKHNTGKINPNIKYDYGNKDSLPNINGNIKTILVKSVTEADNELFKNPIKLAKIIQDSELKNPDINIRVSRNSKTIILEVSNNPTLVSKLLNLKTLGNWNIKAFIPKKEQFAYGVVSPIDSDINLLELQEQIMANNDINIHHIERLNTRRNNTIIPSPTIKISFEQDLPTTLNIGFSVYKVRPYIFAPIQCYNCQRLGHTANNCKGKKRCLKCGECHIYKECTTEKQKCANCGQEHMANSKQCNIIKNAYNIEYFKAKGLSQSEAINKATHCENNIQQKDGLKANYRNKLLINIHKKDNSSTNTQVQTNCNVGTQTTFLEASTQTISAGYNTNYQKDAATQCGDEELKECSYGELKECSSIKPTNNDNANIIDMMQQFMSKMVQAVCEIMNLNLHKLNEEKRTSIIKSKLSKNLHLFTTENNTENLQSDNSCPEGVISCESGEDSKKEVSRRKKRKKR